MSLGKDGQAASGITWFIAFIIIFFMIIIFASFVISVNVQRALSFSNLLSFGGRSTNVNSDPDRVYDAQRAMFAFVSLNYDNVDLAYLINNLITPTNEIGKQEFNSKANDFLIKLVSSSNSGFSGGWMRIYAFEEPVGKDKSNIYPGYDSFVGSGDCSPNSAGYVTIIIPYTEKFKIAGCFKIAR
jgi:hypothetical protein